MIFDQEPGHEEEDELFQMTAMVDVVFILLTFFVLSVQFHGGERDLAMGYTQPGLPTGAAAEDFPPEILVRLARGDAGKVRISVGQTILAEDGFRDLTSVLTQINVPSIPVVIAADPRLSVQQVATAMDAVLASPMKRLSLSRLSLESGP
jgi:biopolymer transport protein ExbD